MTDIEVQKMALEVKKQNGSLDDLVAKFTNASRDSTEFKKTKDSIQQKLSALRKALRQRCEASGIPVERISQVIPNFRSGRKSSKSEQLDELFSSIAGEEE